jgi:hypothetical protein
MSHHGRGQILLASKMVRQCPFFLGLEILLREGKVVEKWKI